MKRIRLAVSAIVLATLAACGGGGDGNQAPAVQYSQMVVFGDSLSDVGTYGGTSSGTPYGVGLAGGGKYTINGLPGSKNWTELIATQLNLPAPCAAETGLNSSGPFAAFFTATTDHPDCYNYAQGGSRVTDPLGMANANLLSLTPPNPHGYLGQLTVPVVTQIQHHLAKPSVGGSFSGKELVMVLAGANDAFMNLGQVNPKIKAWVTGVLPLTTADIKALNPAPYQPYNPYDPSDPNKKPYNPSPQYQAWLAHSASVATLINGSFGGSFPLNQAQLATLTAAQLSDYSAVVPVASALAASEAVSAMTTAATDLVKDVKEQILAKGAKRVAVITVPDISVTPSLVSQGADAASLANLLVRTFNTVLTQGLANTDGVMIVDAYTASQEQHADPAHYGLTNVTTQACDSALVDTSLLCTQSTLIAGDTNHYLFADGVHPTPYGYKLFAQLVSAKLAARGWL